MKLISLVGILAITHGTAFADSACFSDDGGPQGKVCIDKVTYDPYDQATKRAALVISGWRPGSVFTVVRSDYLTDQTVELTAVRVDVEGPHTGCGAAKWTRTTVRTVYDFSSQIDPSRIKMSAERSETPDSCHVTPDESSFEYKLII